MSAFSKILTMIVVFSMTCTGGASTRPAVSGSSSPERVSGHYWQRIVDPTHPEAPPRLVLTETVDSNTVEGKPRRSVVCVRAGEHLVLHQTGARSPILSLAAIALENGACGARIRARIEATRAVAEVMILEQGIGILDGREEKWH